MQELYNALTTPLASLQERLPARPGEKQYPLRYLSTFFADVIYKTNFVQYLYTYGYEGMDDDDRAYLELENIFGPCVIPLLLAFDGELTQEEYNAYLHCFPLAEVLEKLASTDVLEEEISQTIISNYFARHEREANFILNYCHEHEAECIVPYVIKYSPNYEEFESLVNGEYACQIILVALKLTQERKDDRYLECVFRKWSTHPKGVTINRFLEAISPKARTHAELVLLLEKALKLDLFRWDYAIFEMYRSGVSIGAMAEAGMPLQLLAKHPAGKEWLETNDV